MSSKDKENVVCPVCSSFEPQTWRKNLCKNCFHELDEHNNEGDVKEIDNKKADASPDKNKTGTDKDKRKSIIDETDQKKTTTDVKDKSTSKKAIPETPAKTSSSSKTNQNVTQKMKENLDQKQKSSSALSSKLLAGKSDPQKSDDKIPDKSPQTIGQKCKENIDQKLKTSTSKSPGKLDLTKSSFDKMSQSTSNVTSRDDAKKQTTPDKNTPRDVGDTKLGQKFETDKKPSSANIIPKPKTPTSQENDKSVLNKNQKFIDDKDAKKSITPDRDSKSKQEEKDRSSKVKNFAKSFSFSAGDDADDARFNSLGRKKVKDKSPSPQTPTLSSAESKTGIKCQFPAKDENVSQKAAVGGKVDKVITGSSASSVNKNTPDLPQKKNVDLTKSKDSGNEKDVNKTTSGLFGKDKGEKEKGKDTGSEKIGRNIDKLFNKSDSNKNVWKLPSKGGKEEEYDKTKRNSLSDVVLSENASKIDQDLEKLKAQLAQMEKKCTTLEDENKKLKHGLTEKEKQERQLKIQKSDVENSIKSLSNQLSLMETRCVKLDTDNVTLMDKLKQQQVNQEKLSDKVTAEEMKKMEEEVQESEDTCTELQDENEVLKQEIHELKAEMEEMYDNFRDQEAEEFRELQRDLEVTSKNCRILQFKLRKAERKSEQVEKDRDHYEEKLKMLQSSFNSEDARSHIQALEEELRMAKEVSVRLHDQLDVLEDKGSKMDEENQHLTRLLELSDKKQFRMEMEIDKLRDQVLDMRDKMKDKSQPSTPSDEITDRKPIYKILLDKD